MRFSKASSVATFRTRLTNRSSAACRNRMRRVRHAPHSALLTPHSALGFTLIELVVVMTILIILVGLVIAVGSNVTDMARKRQTNVTLQVLDTAIEQFARANPLAAWSSNAGPLGAGDLTWTTPPINVSYKLSFGPYPPHYDWYALETNPAIDVPARSWTLAQRPTTPVFAEYNNSRAALLYDTDGALNPFIPPPNFFAINGPNLALAPTLPRHHGGNNGEYGDPDALNPGRRDIENSESLYFWLTEMSPESAVLMDRLPKNAITNTDVYARVEGATKVTPLPDLIDPLGNTAAGGVVAATATDDRELKEIRDAWGNVISYWVYYFNDEGPGALGHNGMYDGPQNPSTVNILNPEFPITPVPVLESAGPDGKFGHRAGISHNHDNPDPLDSEADIADNLWSRQPPTEKN